MHPSPLQQQNKSKRPAFALIGGLCLLVLAQFILFPLLFAFLVHHPLVSTPTFYNYLDSFQNVQQQRLKADLHQPPDGSFNGAPMYLSTEPLVSKVHCVGDNFHADAWQYKSCRFHNLCFDTSTSNFVLFQDERELPLHVALHRRPFMAFSSITQRNANETNALSLGGLNQKWAKQKERLKWFPDIKMDPPETYYRLSDAVVLVPFHSMNGANPGHLVWDDFFPIYNLLEMFQLQNRQLLLLRHVLNDGMRALWATCDVRLEKKKECEYMMNKFLPLMLGLDSSHRLTSTNATEFLPNDTGKSHWVCARTSVAGIGSLTDHGVKKSHGWDESDYELTHNYGRGGNLFAFRNFMVQNLKLPNPVARTKSPHRIVFSSRSSDIPSRDIDFAMTINALKQAFPNDIVEGFIMKDLSLLEQIEIATQTSIYITVCGGGAVNAMFLPRGASAIIYFSEDGGVVENHLTYLPARLDWDLFQHMSHLRVHWMPRNTFKRNNSIDLQALIDLVRHELYVMDRGFFD
ncbi:hypothetical protein MPSEU_000974500 [Mayamaea pseudoterrestris]|nr:hypothetical protein MPSEU_000974500 [Mayamaea pseudoterrestris]